MIVQNRHINTTFTLQCIVSGTHGDDGTRAQQPAELVQNEEQGLNDEKCTEANHAMGNMRFTRPATGNYVRVCGQNIFIDGMWSTKFIVCS